MYNLSADEISMVDGGGDGNSSGYPASPSAVAQQANSPSRACGQAIATGAVVNGMAGGYMGGLKGAVAGAVAGGFSAAMSGTCNI
ncbi:hypothetical protein VTH8203_04015 [Vibrio thalassae]|uniref:Bacteriocin class II with double-glycine leader peptide n=1 Tax=Vibrio thalassae TaxID=1243014 RepID=A0A240EP04_9VIBR|nr:hypothetical protein [Vibrio thalassae]SNX50356.1 hypothetical protein VTH8203_04015 [Vibrio thalassae]